MKKKAKSPLEQQAEKRFLKQIIGLHPSEEKSQSGFHKIINKIKAIF